MINSIIKNKMPTSLSQLINDIGAGEQGVITLYSSYTVTTETDTVPINIPAFVKGRDVIILSQGGTMNFYPADFTISSDSKTAHRNNGLTWKPDELIEFFVMQFTEDGSVSPLEFETITSYFTAPADSTSYCLINNPEYNPATDELEVIYKRQILGEVDDYIKNPDNISITLTSGNYLKQGDKLTFKVRKLAAQKSTSPTPPTITINDLNTVLQGMIRDSYLLCDYVRNTNKTIISKDSNGYPLIVKHISKTDGISALRTDNFVYGTNLITETRTLNTGDTITLITHTNTNIVEVI
jgi:hypothetical protein